MLPADHAVRAKALDLIKQILSARGELTGTDTERFERVAKLFDTGSNGGPLRTLVPRPSVRDEALVKAS
jgi:hypothetical protein